jgi:DNA-binding transcriptional ArsR family regulator
MAPNEVDDSARVGSLADVRRITDARTLRALAHPVRIALLEALILEGAMTATEVGGQIGESPTTCSFHLRQLAKYGFVEEAGGGKGRARPWRVTSIGMRFGSSDDDPESAIAARALDTLIWDRMLERYGIWRETKPSYPSEWRDAAHDTEFVFHLTAEELEQLNEELANLLIPRFQERLLDPSLRPPGSLPVELLLLSYPMRPPAGEE